MSDRFWNIEIPPIEMRAWSRMPVGTIAVLQDGKIVAVFKDVGPNDLPLGTFESLNPPPPGMEWAIINGEKVAVHKLEEWACPKCGSNNIHETTEPRMLSPEPMRWKCNDCGAMNEGMRKWLKV